MTFLYALLQWLTDVISLQCSIMRHLRNKQTSSPWDSKQMEKTNDRDSCQSTQNPGPKAVCSSCTDGLCQNCRTTNGPVDSLVKPNGMQGPVRPSDKTTAPLNHASSNAGIKSEDSSLKSCTATDVPPPASVKSEPTTSPCNHEKTPAPSDTPSSEKLTDSSVSTGAPDVKPLKTDTGSGHQKSSSCGKDIAVIFGQFNSHQT